MPYLRSGTVPTQAWWTEKRREMYVAVTRTEDQLYLMVRDGRAQSSFLAELGVRAGRALAVGLSSTGAERGRR